MRIESQSRRHRNIYVLHVLSIGFGLAIMLLASAAMAVTGEQPERAEDNLPKINEFIALDVQPELKHREPAVYPRLAQKGHIEGVVHMKALVAMDGSVIDAVVIKSSDSKMLDRAAVRATLKNRYTPGKVKSKPIACWIPCKVEFAIEG